MKLKRVIRILLLVLVIGAVFLAGGIWWIVRESLQPQTGKVQVHGVSGPVKIGFDNLGIPHVVAATSSDAAFAHGFITARDRLFQMDIARRYASGTLAEIIGPLAAPVDTEQRFLNLQQTAGQMVINLPANQREMLAAYAAGVNAFLEKMRVAPPEFLALHYTPERWKPSDSALVILGMFVQLGYSERGDRTKTTLAEALGSDVAAFFTPESDVYEAPVIAGDPWLPPAPVPLDHLRQIVASSTTSEDSLVRLFEDTLGSNAWVVSPAKSGNGRAILANDMHLVLRVPATWYRAEFDIAGRFIAGLSLPGVPGIVAGSSPDVAWGFANLFADTTDLVFIERNPANNAEYKTRDGWKSFGTRDEVIRVKGAATLTVRFHETIWGTVSPKMLNGRTVAVQWTGADAANPDLALLEIPDARSVAQAADLFNRFTGPPQSTVLAGSNGDIGWTICGRIPLRSPDADGTQARTWNSDGWTGYVARVTAARPESLARLRCRCQSADDRTEQCDPAWTSVRNRMARTADRQAARQNQRR